MVSESDPESDSGVHNARLHGSASDTSDSESARHWVPEYILRAAMPHMCPTVRLTECRGQEWGGFRLFK